MARYVGGEAPRLHRLGTNDWTKQKARVKRAVRDMAGELVRLYSVRMSVKGHAFGPDTPWQREFEAAFPYEETPDQLSAIDEVKHDMESDEPMDRLLCGDVGYGKTEVAMRAAFKAVDAGKQVAVLVPTTVLAEQHYRTFTRAHGRVPVKIDAVAIPHTRRAEGDRQDGSQRARSTSSSARTGCVSPTCVSRTWGWWSSTRSSGSASSEGAAEGAAADRRRADDDRHADPADAADVVAGISGTSRRRDAAR